MSGEPTDDPSRTGPVARAPVVTTKDVAARARVAVGTVSNVLNNPHLVSATTRRRVEEAVTELGSSPNESARALRLGPEPDGRPGGPRHRGNDLIAIGVLGEARR